MQGTIEEAKLNEAYDDDPITKLISSYSGDNLNDDDDFKMRFVEID